MRRVVDYMLVDLDAAAASGHPLRQLLAEGWELYGGPFWNGGNGGGYAPGPCQAVARYEEERGEAPRPLPDYLSLEDYP